METTNRSLVTEFILQGLSEDPQLKIVLSFVFSVIYLVTVWGNMILITVCVLEPRLHTPMYFFLVNLSILDICYSSVIVPNLIVQLVVRTPMSFSACVTQLYSYQLLAGTECVLLAVMAYDRYVAISYPLRYTYIMRTDMSTALAASSWISGSLLSIVSTVFTMRLPICGSNVIKHFFCEITTLIKMACADTYVTELVIFSLGILVLLVPCLFILISYICIIITIIGIRSSKRRYKAFSTSASHLIVVIIVYGTTIYVIMKPVQKNSTGHDEIVSVFYTAFPPLLNPIIYSLRNSDVKMALKKVMQRLLLKETNTSEK